jgi:putative nucleotide binding protein
MSSAAEPPKKFEDYAYVLDYLAHGKAGLTRGVFKAEPIIQLIGETYFTLLEATPRSGVVVNQGMRIYIGKDQPRQAISHILGRVNYNDLSPAGKAELPFVIEEAIKNNEVRFVDFFNTANAVTPRMHSLELIPGIGKKYAWAILDTREKRPFQNLKDVRERTQLPDPIKLLSRRIVEELSQEDPKYRLFTRQP